jgi:hypothetical protein
LNITVDSEESYRQVLNGDRKLYDVSTSSDIFITSKFIWRKIIHEMPEFILGRYGWDNWLHTIAELKGFRKFNCTNVLTILHCKHNHQHILLQEKKQKQSAASSQYNLALWKKVLDVYGTTRINAWPQIEIEVKK